MFLNLKQDLTESKYKEKYGEDVSLFEAFLYQSYEIADLAMKVKVKKNRVQTELQLT